MTEQMEPRYGERFLDALRLAAEAHRTQPRKGTEIPYVSHLMAVSALVWEGGGDEDQAIAGLLHDLLEDQGHVVDLVGIEARFGERVARMVADCSDATPAPGQVKAPWATRKQRHVDHVAHMDADTLLVLVADKLHNTRCMLEDLDALGVERLYERFNATPSGTVWYLDAMVSAVRSRTEFASPLLDRLDTTVDALAAAMGVDRATATPAARS